VDNLAISWMCKVLSLDSFIKMSIRRQEVVTMRTGAPRTLGGMRAKRVVLAVSSQAVLSADPLIGVLGIATAEGYALNMAAA
jgi:hypothetical protein